MAGAPAPVSVPATLPLLRCNAVGPFFYFAYNTSKYRFLSFSIVPVLGVRPNKCFTAFEQFRLDYNGYDKLNTICCCSYVFSSIVGWFSDKFILMINNKVVLSCAKLRSSYARQPILKC